MKYLDIENWNRREHFDFYRQFEEPFFGVTVNMDVTIAKIKAKELNTSFFLYYLHQSIKSINEIEAFRYRITEDNRVIVHDKIDAGSTVARADGTFGFGYFPFSKEYEVFEKTGKESIRYVRNSKGIMLSKPPSGLDDIIHYSVLKWIKFTSFSHARAFKVKDSIPKIMFGKTFQEGDKLLIPMSVHVHHALMDGFHLSQYIDRFQVLLNQ
ncbi:MAG: CatA-like O-acetyltransferase [Saprospiraceae bacterium]